MTWQPGWKIRGSEIEAVLRSDIGKADRSEITVSDKTQLLSS
jgi:hypothetical protein